MVFYQEIKMSMVKQKSAEPYNTKLTKSEDVVRFIKPMFIDDPQENLIVAYLNTRGRVIGVFHAFKGSVNQCIVDPAEVFRGALLSGSTQIVVVHNHPSGDPEPSSEDLMICMRLQECGKILGIRQLDFIIIGDEGHTSLADEGLLNGVGNENTKKM